MTGPPATILIVDDEIRNRKLLEMLLRPEGYLTISAANGTEALSAVAQQAPDLILLDVMMPGMDGYEVARLLKTDAATSNIPIIMVTASTDRSARLAGLDSGAEEFLSKPVDRAELWLRVRNMLRLKAFGDFLKNHGAILEEKVQARTAELHASELRFRQIAENIREVFWLTDPAKNEILYISPAYEKIWGRTCESVYASPRDWTDAIHDEDRQRVVHAAQTKQAIGMYEEEYRIVRPDGTLRWIRDRAFPVRGETNEIYRIAGLAEDITESRRAGEELRESERRFSDMLRNVELASVMLDRKGCITFCNEYLLRLTGWQIDEVMGRNWFSLFQPSDLDGKDFFDKLLGEVPKAWHRESEIVTRSGKRRLMRWNNSALRSGLGDVVGSASIGEDITEQRQAEIRIKGLNRVYAVLSGINTLIVRVRDRDELFLEACRIAVTQGEFRMAWIGLVDPGDMKIVPVASCGVDAEHLAALKFLFRPAGQVGLGNTLAAQSIRDKKVVVCNDLQNDPAIVFARKHTDAGIRSVAFLPLIVSEAAVGLLVLYASKVEFFHAEGMKLLTELASDIALAIDHIQKQERLDYLAYYDVLTGLANRNLFLERVAQHLRGAAIAEHKVALFLVDLERFKNINDSLGRPAGDALLRQVAAWLTQQAGDVSLVARVGADHFAIVLARVKQDGDVARLLERTLDAFREHPFRLDDSVLRIAIKCGVALFPDDGANADTLFKNAEAALKKAKATGDRYLFYTQAMNETAAGNLSLENQLREALAKEEFVLHYQPKVNLATGELTSAEALIRWNNPRTGMVAPLAFIPILEETGLIHEVGRWVVQRAIEDCLRWRRAGLATVRIAVNVSPLQLRHRGFIAEIGRAVGIDTRVAAGLELEITESLIMEDVKHSIASLQALRAMGVRIAIDDFGTGFSSLSYLSRLPVDTLKIDRSFIVDMTAGPEGLSLVSTIINLAHSLKLNVVAEGVETDEQARLLRLLTCDEMQGNLYCKPLSAAEFESRYLALPVSDSATTQRNHAAVGGFGPEQSMLPD